MNKSVRNGKEILDDFFNNILNIPEVDEKLASAVKELYKEGNLTNTKLSNLLSSLREE